MSWNFAEGIAREERKKRVEQRVKPLFEEPENERTLSVGFYL